MENKLVLMAIIGLVLIAGCVESSNQSYNPTTSEVHNYEETQTTRNQATLDTNQPAPRITKSLERENLIRRINLINDENKVFYVYLLSHGKVVAFFVAKGKVSSLNSYLTNMNQWVKSPECIDEVRGTTSGDRSGCFAMTEAPDLDGTYGENPDGIFFYTTDGAYVEWNAEYLVSDYPLKITTPVDLVREVE